MDGHLLAAEATVEFSQQGEEVKEIDAPPRAWRSTGQRFRSVWEVKGPVDWLSFSNLLQLVNQDLLRLPGTEAALAASCPVQQKC